MVSLGLSGKHKSIKFFISEEDVSRVSKYDWKLWGKYPHNSDIGKLHKFIIGSRAEDIPDTFVIDHVDRNPLNAKRSNLRWVSPQFNSWNQASRNNLVSRFKGVSFHKRSRKWRACFLKKTKDFNQERDAALWVAKAAIIKWPHLAASSDLLFSENLLTSEELLIIQNEIDNEYSTGLIQKLPTGVFERNHKFGARYAKTDLGTYDTVNEAKIVYSKAVEKAAIQKQDKIKKEWQAHQEIPVKRDVLGNAIIKLSNKTTDEQFALVPERFWHQLTFRVTWYYNQGYAFSTYQGKTTAMHRLVYRLCYPGTIIQGTIDHINANEKLNNLETNLRDATRTMQSCNKVKKPGCSSECIGVSYHKTVKKWQARYFHEGKRHHFGFYACEQHAVEALQKKTQQLVSAE